MPAADDLFRPTSEPSGPAVRAVPDPPAELPTDAPKGPSGRVRHDEKITVYVTSAELMELERARLTLRGEHGMAVDRGRLVREALHLVLGELEAEGESSALVRRLRES
ncbi:hypothetical protein [Nocardioides sp. L-11A]|uniref:hypothetical protein n=1 Tax=Nocardioides sp. L-11A TaxID=3043848 RepID=UPI00249BA963|nr:hypothetical protein QJ852_14780 [Nocardioides sp. L-11A]